MLQHLDLGPDVIVGGRYRLVEALARGGTSSVWLAVDETSGREVALKTPSDGVDEALRRRAEREAAALEGIDHPHVVRVLDSGIDDGLPFLVMELVSGAPLSDVIRQRGALPVDEALDLVTDVASGLGVAHEHGVVHRDVKPSNIVCGDGGPVLVDFGIAGVPDSTTLTRGLVLGTAAYLSPEQAQGGDLGPASDVYSLGCVLYELLTGTKPFSGSSPIAVAVAHVQEPPCPPADLTDVPPAVNDIVMRCLAKEPGHRPADGSALAAELRGARADARASDETTVIAAVRDRTEVMPAIARPDVSPIVVDAPSSSSRPPVAVLVAIAAVAIAIGVAVGLLTMGDATDAEEPDVPATTVAPAAIPPSSEVSTTVPAGDAPATNEGRGRGNGRGKH
jgi:serine/threonine-protein kinase